MIFSEGLNFTALDIETTGLSERNNEIIQIAAIRFRNGKVDKIFNSFVKPKDEVPNFIVFLTHISMKELDNAPDIELVLRKLGDFVGKDIIVGHNISFDMGFINYNFGKIGEFPLNNSTWDTAELSRVYLPFTTNHKLGTVLNHFHIPLDNAHRADADAMATGKLLLALADYASLKFSMLVNARLQGFAVMAQSPSQTFFEEIVRFQRSTALSAPPSAQLKSPYYNIIDNSLPATKDPQIEEVFSQDGLFAHRFPNFEFRLGQLQMAKAVSDAFKNEEHLVVEAGTGVGKSFAYLVPSIEFSCQNRAKVVVSTNTKNLQEQLFYKDLPQLAQILPVPFKAVLIKGRENYICERRWEELISQSAKELNNWDAQALMYLYIWKLQTITGDISENSSFDRSRYNITWRKICSDRYLCGNRKCQHFRRCHVMTLRREIETASVVVANHALLLADMRMENSSLGEYNYLVIDEAHNLMASASKHLGASISYADVIILINQIAGSSRRHSKSFLATLEKALIKSPISEAKREQSLSTLKHLEDVIDVVRKPILDIFNLASAMCTAADSYNKMRIKSKDDAKDLFSLLEKFCLLFKDVLKSAQALENVISALESKQVAGYDQHFEAISAYIMRLSEMEGVLLSISQPDLDDYALWIENNPRPDRNVPAAVFNYAPIEVNVFLKRLMYSQVPSIIFTSATLALRGSFRYFLNQSGLSLLEDKKVVERIVESPFDYNQQSKLLITSFLPEPKDRFFPHQAISCLKQIFQMVDVGTMALFTAYRDLDFVFDELADEMYHAQRPFFAQGKGSSRSSILEEFKKTNNAILLGTSSFWEGVDVQGDSLSLLILYKIPFQVPSEPLVEAYIDKLERENKDSFMHYMLPNALLRIRQGFGRLIRSKSDRGIVLIMDSRVSHKRYGSYFKAILPGKHIELKDEMQLITEITRFFSII